MILKSLCVHVASNKRPNFISVGKANKWDQVINKENAQKLGKGENRQNVVTPLWQNVVTRLLQKSIGSIEIC